MSSFTLRCFGPGLPRAGSSAAGSFQQDALLLDLLGDSQLAVATARIQVTAGGFDHQQLLLSWQDQAGSWSAVVGASGLANFLQQAPAVLQPALQQWRAKTRSTHRRFHLAMIVLALLLSLPLIALGVFWWQAENIAGWVAERVPPQSEQQLGELSFAQVKAGGKLVSGHPAQRALEQIGARLTQGSRYRYQWFVLQDDSINAFAMPGGYVVVHSGLIKAADTAEELAGVLAHEVQHVEQRHSLKGLIHGLGWQAALSLVLGDLSGSVWGDLANQLGQLKFSRAQESEADLGGLRALLRADIDPSGMRRFFEKMAQRDGSQVTLLSSHPASAERFAAMQDALKEMPIKSLTPLPYDWAALKQEPKQPIKPQ